MAPCVSRRRSLPRRWAALSHRHPEKGHLRPGNHAPLSYVALLLTMLAALGALCLLFALLIGGLALVVLQYPNGDWFSTPPYARNPTTHFNHGPWMLGRAVGWCAAAAVLAGIASYCVGMVWEAPRVAILETKAVGEGEQRSD